MVSVVGRYQNGYVEFARKIFFTKPVKVIITFLEDIVTSYEKDLSLSDWFP